MLFLSMDLHLFLSSVCCCWSVWLSPWGRITYSSTCLSVTGWTASHWRVVLQITNTGDETFSSSININTLCYWNRAAALFLSLAAALQGPFESDKLIKLRFSWPMECSDRQLGCGCAVPCGCYFSGPKWPPGKTCGGTGRGEGRWR